MAVIGAACVPPEDDDTLTLRQFSDSSVMAELQETGVVTIGVPTDIAPLASMPERDGSRLRGFTVDLGSLVADALGVDAEFVSTPSSTDPATAQAAADLVFTARPLTEEAVRAHSYTNPYLLVHQRLLVRAASGIGGSADLEGRRVCSLIDPRTEVPLDRLAPAVELVPSAAAHKCARLIAKGAVDAVTAADIVLMDILESLSKRGDRADSFRIVGDQLTTEGYASLVEEGTGGFGGFVDSVLASAEADGTWSRLYKRWMGRYTTEIAEPPELSLEEAAALFPTPTE